MARMGRNNKEDIHAFPVKASASPSNIIKTELGEFRMLRDQLWWAMREWLRADPTAMLPPDPYLIEELRTPTYLVSPITGKLEITHKDVLRDLLRRSPDRSDALAMTFMPLERPKIITLDTVSSEVNYVR